MRLKGRDKTPGFFCGCIFLKRGVYLVLKSKNRNTSMLNENSLNSFIEEEGTLISFVNHHFGPLRGLNFIVKGNSKEVIEEYLEKQPNETIDEIWGETLISSRAMALPMQLVDELESPPSVVDSLEEGEEQIRKNVVRGNLTGDPFFFRSFII